jgi:feruloyl-CoA synthase
MLKTDLRFAPARVNVDRRADGTTLLSSPLELGSYARCVGEWLVGWAGKTPDRPFLAERVSTNTSGAGDGWRKLTYRETLDAVRKIGTALLERGLSQDKPLVVLSDNSIDHALLMLGAMHAGVTYAPVSPAYSLMSQDHAKLKYLFELLRPGMVWVSDPQRFGPALAAVGATATPIADLLQATPGRRIDEAFANVTPDTIAKILFTSGSTGMPKGVINTQRMLVSNQEMTLRGWPWVSDRPPVLVEWLPWNHTFGGNYGFNLVLRNGGTLHIDGGKPMPGALIETTVRNLKEVSPTQYYNVPRGFDLLMPYFESDADLRRNFFRDLDIVFYAGAALPQNLWERLEKLASAEKGGKLAMLSAWGSTETSPLATQVHFPIPRAGVIGLPVAGCTLKLVPSGSKLEVRVRGPNVTPGYWKREDLTKAAFDEEGFYRIGDAVKFADPADPTQGIVFDGRVAEDFKLSTGTWVSVGTVRVNLIAAGNPVIQDAVITGHDRDEIGALVFLSPAAKDMDAAAVEARLKGALAALANTGGSSTHPTRLLVMSAPASIDAGEITDKGYINQRAVLENRAALVELLHAGGAGVVTA